MNKYTGSCLCQKVQVKVTASLQSFVFCHCSRCQKTSGSAHGSNVFADKWDLEWISGESEVHVYHHAGTRFESAFCKTCGSKVPVIENDWLMIPAGFLDNEINFPPTGHIHMASRASWEENLDSIPKHDVYPKP